MVIKGTIKKRYRQALNFYAAMIFTHQLSKHVEVQVRFCKFVDGLKGLAIVEGYNESGKPRSFIIEVNRQESESEILKTLAHELIHCRQYAKQELNEEMTIWQGKFVNSHKIPYDEQPWEIEAEMTGNLLYESFVAT